MYHGIINVFKEQGYTSFDVVAKLRGICKQKKIGHTGTLDPDAEGVLPVCLGKATKVCDLLTDREKEYQAVLLLGIETDTQDTSGRILEEKSTEGITEDQVRTVIGSFVGEQKQVPPMYSALKVNGQKLCDLARKGQVVERKARDITIFQIEINEIHLPRVSMTVKCSKGTYIRTLCHDIGKALGCNGAMEHLLRTQAAGYRVEDAMKLSEIQSLQESGELEQRIRGVEDVFSDLPVIQTKDAVGDKVLLNGNALFAPMMINEDIIRSTNVRVLDSNGNFCAVYVFSEEKGCYKPVKMFL